jgi:uncharacterized protein (DUF433 family)
MSILSQPGSFCHLTKALLLNLIANGSSQEEILEDYPYLEPEDIRQALQYAAWLAEETVYTNRDG